ncbi:hypothetical protein CEXT_809101 [Caerostris extrusa]|uniref:Uncharacterized protein n=1 Tax=Caerostris extrusa TaxID=172846 RepID=A0AAV4TYR6_CAEEX|nr:hypothetical protein CEXT_809101 [Caerostris extrusa]
MVVRVVPGGYVRGGGRGNSKPEIKPASYQDLLMHFVQPKHRERYARATRSSSGSSTSTKKMRNGQKFPTGFKFPTNLLTENVILMDADSLYFKCVVKLYFKKGK